MIVVRYRKSIVLQNADFSLVKKGIYPYISAADVRILVGAKRTYFGDLTNDSYNTIPVPFADRYVLVDLENLLGPSSHAHHSIYFISAMAVPMATTPPPRSVETLTLDIPCYSETKKNLPNGNGITSDAVVAGGRSWHISFYPNGWYPDTTDATSVFLLLDDANAGGDDVQVELKFMLLEFGGGDPPHFVSSTFTKSFSPSKTSIGLNLSRFVSHEDLDKSVLAKHDRFTIRCDFAVQPPPASPCRRLLIGRIHPPRH